MYSSNGKPFDDRLPRSRLSLEFVPERKRLVPDNLPPSKSLSLSLEFERYLEMYKSWGKRRMEHPCGEFNEAILLKRAAASFDVYRRR